MAWAMELSPAGFDEMLTDLARMDRKTGRAYLQLLGYLRRFGSVPSKERALASVLGVTVRFLRDIAWPLLEDRLVLSEDKRRYFSQEVTRGDKPIVKSAVPPEISEVRRAAGTAGVKAREEKKRNLSLVEASYPDFASPQDANRDANGHANPMQTEAKDDAKSTADVSGLHDFASGFASEVADAPLPTLASFPSSQPTDQSIESKEGSGGEVVGARAGADAAGIQTAKQTDANGHANGHAKPDANRASRTRLAGPGRSRMTEDWQPPASVAAACTDILGHDLAETLEAFRDHWLANGETKLDWSAALRGWCRREIKMGFDPKSRQGHIPMPIRGGRAKEGPGAFINVEAERIAAKHEARRQPSDDEGPILEGLAS